MKVYYKTIVGAALGWEQLGEPEPCCEKMVIALEDKAIRWGAGNGPGLYFSHSHNYPEGEDTEDYLINHCPFCGQKIEAEEKLRVKLKARSVTRTITAVEYDEEVVKEMGLDKEV